MNNVIQFPDRKHKLIISMKENFDEYFGDFIKVLVDLNHEIHKDNKSKLTKENQTDIDKIYENVHSLIKNVIDCSD